MWYTQAFDSSDAYMLRIRRLEVVPFYGAKNLEGLVRSR